MNNINHGQSQSGPDHSHTVDRINDDLRAMRQVSSTEDLNKIAFESRNHPTHGVYISHSKPTIVYVSICCAKRKPWLTTDKHHKVLLDIWQDTSHWVVGRYVLMPDYLHLFAAPQATAVDFESWVKYFKSQFTKRNRDNSCIWQTGHWDTRIRDHEHYEEKSIYMFNNPVRAELVNAASDWKFKGVVHELRWE